MWRQNQNMEASEDRGLDVECVVNRWMVDYYVSVAFEAFKNEQDTDFCEIRDILQCHLVRPLEANDATPKKIRAIQFLARINDGDKLDFSFDSQEDLTPLESALSVLDSIREELPVPQKDVDRVQKSIREMLVIVCLKNQAFDKAKEVLMKYFPKSMVGKKAIFLGLVNKRSSEHSVLQQVTYQQFKQEMLLFCESLFPYAHPFLSRAARQLMVKRQEAGQGAEEGDCPSDPQPEDHLVPATEEKASRHKPSPPSPPPGGVLLTRSQLMAVYTALAEELKEPMTFAELEEEVEMEVMEENAGKGVAVVDQEEPLLHLSESPRQGSDAVLEQEVPRSQRDSDSPMEASPADLVPPADLAPGPQWKSRGWPHTIARLVMEPDSQDSTASRESVSNGEESVSRADPLSSASTYSPPTRKYRKRRASKIPEETSPDPEEDVCILDNSPEQRGSAPQRSSTPTPQRGSAPQRSSTPTPQRGSAPQRSPTPTPQIGSAPQRSSTPTPQRGSAHQRSPTHQRSSTPTPQRGSAPQRSSTPTPQRGSSHKRSPTSQTSHTHQRSPTPQRGSSHKRSPTPQTSPTPQRSPTPQKASTSKKGTDLKWKQLFIVAKESKDRWSDEEDLFDSPHKDSSEDNASTTGGGRKRVSLGSEDRKRVSLGSGDRKRVSRL
ncbi:telomeric repeat-binding factor 2-like [Salvelinus fontinalis]|uniref:telomeric repeat-binding factor 2-like n=1 Tax=Salvelinus fontinalis TaxID=8038 RepID=UPI0024851441|nr:telomeric repeat-binding factor 2-like [Salvelinus fontinalis]